MSDEEVRNAIEVVRNAIAEDFIVDGCREHSAVGCASCEMIILDRQLETLLSEYDGSTSGALRKAERKP